LNRGLDKLGRRLERARKALQGGKLERQIGRLLERNAHAAGRYLIDLVEDSSLPAGVRIKWSVRPQWDDWAGHSEGCYLLRTNLTDWDAEQLWRTQVQLGEVEAADRSPSLGGKTAYHATYLLVDVAPTRRSYIPWP
jgi:hypothetical protein